MRKLGGGDYFKETPTGGLPNYDFAPTTLGLSNRLIKSKEVEIVSLLGLVSWGGASVQAPAIHILRIMLSW
jgi:hypothetical protein